MHSVMTHSFSQVPKVEIPRSSFDRSHGYKTTFNAGYLVPVFLDEALPGDTFNLSMNVFARLATPIHPFMDNLFMDSFFFAVPYRLVWDNFKRSMGEQANPSDSVDYSIPQMTSPNGGYAIGSLQDYMGLPTVGQVGGAVGVTHNSLFLRGYNLIWNEWFRDQNLQNSVVVDKDDGPDNPADYVLLKRGKRHDYFTSCLPWPQKGTAVPLPLTGNAPVIGNGKAIGLTDGTLNYGFGAGGTGNTGGWTGVFNVAQGTLTNSGTQANTKNLGLATSNSGMVADLSSVTAATINSLRQAFQLQRLLERDARGGTRYTEIVRAHFGVQSPDARLQRPEYLGGGSTPVNINPIAQTSVTAATPQGNLAAMGTIKVVGHGFTKSFTEHSLIIGLVCVRADLNYQQGLNRMWSRRTKYDHYWPALAYLGEQTVLNKEIYCDGSANDAGVFGYQERYAEYRYKPSQITGLFRSTAATSLDVWHLAQDFGSLPTLNSTFIQETPPIGRVIAVNTEPHFLFDSYFRLKCARPMPVFGVPGFIDHF